MTSINTNTSAMNALSTLRNVNNNLNTTQDRISSGLKVASGKDNAAYFAISQNMNSDSSLNKSINEGMTIAKNSVATARLGVEAVVELAKQYIDRQSFGQNLTDTTEIESEMTDLKAQMNNVLAQANFNGESLVDNGDTKTIVTGLYDNGTAMTASNLTVDGQNVGDLVTALTAGFTAGDIDTSKTQLESMVTFATELGITEKAVENQQTFLTSLTDRLDSGISGMVDADMEEEAARLQALQVQQQLSTQALSIANQGPQNILSLFR